MQYLIIAPILAFIAFLWLKIKSLFLTSKLNTETTKLQELKNEDTQKTQDADSAYNDFEQRLRDYKSKK